MIIADFQPPMYTINEYIEVPQIEDLNIQQLIINYEYGYENQAIAEILNNDNLSKQEKIARLCLLTKGKIHYQYGAKIFDEDNVFIDPILDKDKGVYYYNDMALDCSGYIQYIYWLVDEDMGLGTGVQSTEGKTVKEPQIGDLGFIFVGNSGYYDEDGHFSSTEQEDYHFRENHVGIYLGNGTWAHCNGTAQTVSINCVACFHTFQRYL